jgi:hypothetical protein
MSRHSPLRLPPVAAGGDDGTQSGAGDSQVLESTVGYLGVEVEDALEISEQTEV